MTLEAAIHVSRLPRMAIKGVDVEQVARLAAGVVPKLKIAGSYRTTCTRFP
jgi:hypothetical protein